MFRLFKREKKAEEKSCFNCKNFDKKHTRCNATVNTYLKYFPYKKTTCKKYTKK